MPPVQEIFPRFDVVVEHGLAEFDAADVHAVGFGGLEFEDPPAVLGRQGVDDRFGGVLEEAVPLRPGGELDHVDRPEFAGIVRHFQVPFEAVFRCSRIVHIAQLRSGRV